MIDFTRENLLTLQNAAASKLLPKRRGDSRPHVTTLYRWAQRGIRGVRLETLKVGGTLCTSTEALQRFFNQLSDGSLAATEDRGADVQRAERACAEAGI